MELRNLVTKGQNPELHTYRCSGSVSGKRETERPETEEKFLNRSGIVIIQSEQLYIKPVYSIAVRKTSLQYSCTQYQFTVSLCTKPVYSTDVQFLQSWLS